VIGRDRASPQAGSATALLQRLPPGAGVLGTAP